MRLHLSVRILVVLAITLLYSSMPSKAIAHGLPDPPKPVPITITGRITDNGAPVEGLGVVAWCGGLDMFGGWSATNANGEYEIYTNGTDCPLGNNSFLEIFHNDSSVGFAFAYMIIHTQTTVNVKLEEHSTVTVPEFGWAGGAASLAAGGGAIAFVRRRLGH